jgi:hypothetical protein
VKLQVPSGPNTFPPLLVKVAPGAIWQFGTSSTEEFSELPATIELWTVADP